MKLFGSNIGFGTTRIDLTESRYTLPIETEGLRFPRGIAGLIPVVTIRKNGKQKFSYAFPLGEEDVPNPLDDLDPPVSYDQETMIEAEETGKLVSESVEEEAPIEDGLESEEEPLPAGAHFEVASDTDDDAVATDADTHAEDAQVASAPEEEAATEAPADDSFDGDMPAEGELVEQDSTDGTYNRMGYADLTALVEFINKMLDQAGELSRHHFGFVDGVQIAIPESGWGFTRVELVPLDAHGEPSVHPVHLYLETCDEPKSPNSLSASMSFDSYGRVDKLVMIEYAERSHTRVVVSKNQKTDKLSVEKVEIFAADDEKSRLLYKRSKESMFRESRRSTDRGGYRRDRDERASDRDYRGSRDRDRGNRFDRDRDERFGRSREASRGGDYTRDRGLGQGSRFGQDDRGGFGGGRGAYPREDRWSQGGRPSDRPRYDDRPRRDDRGRFDGRSRFEGRDDSYNDGRGDRYRSDDRSGRRDDRGFGGRASNDRYGSREANGFGSDERYRDRRPSGGWRDSQDSPADYRQGREGRFGGGRYGDSL